MSRWLSFTKDLDNDSENRYTVLGIDELTSDDDGSQHAVAHDAHDESKLG